MLGMRGVWANNPELWEEHTVIMVYDGKLPHAEAARLAWAGLPLAGKAR
jgi:hypothetical protein